ncbi:MAG: starch-binding protein, partial [Oscillospiraceae bacterium]|nr:starch-binding protein [Oscillospiraceae bacterium]
MKKSHPASRILSLLLVLVMVFQMVPVFASAGTVNTIASGDDAGTMGIDPSTVNKEGTINWPVKIYDYLNDGMLFEYANMLAQTIGDSTSSQQAGGACYGGGNAVLYTEYGADFTCDPAYSDANWKGYIAGDTGTSYNVTPVDAVDFVSPRYINITKKTAYQNSNFGVGCGYSCSLDDVRYMTLVYRGTGISDDSMSVLLGENWYRTPNTVKLADSKGWTYVVLDLKEMMGENAAYVGTVKSMWITWGGYSNGKYEGLNDGSSIDITHAAFFNEKAAAEHYGDAALSFNANPGQYLNHAGTITVPGVTYPQALKPNALLSLRSDYKGNGSATLEGNGCYGMDLTTYSTANGQYTNGYNSDSYWTWASGTTLSFSYNGGTAKSYPMTAMNVQNLKQNGKDYVRLSNSSASRILLSKFREEASADSNAPSREHVNYMVMVYRTNGMPAGSKFALWAQGAKNSSSSYYVALADASVWSTSSVVNPQNFTICNGDWTYVVINLETTLGARDEDIYQVNYLKRVGMFLPAMSSGQSLDIAYLAYFGDNGTADGFGAQAAAYMNSGITTPSKEVTLSANRGWNSGNNQNFGMLYASSGGSWGVDSYGNRSNTTAGGWNPDPNGYYSYMIGYNTTASSTSVYNTYRQDFNGNFYSQTGGTNNIYFLYPKAGYSTSDLDFDGYQLLETVEDGLFTAGLLEGTLTPDRLPVYRQETVEYIATTLYEALAIPQTDASGNYNYNFIKGSASVQFGGYDLNGDGKIGMADLNGDGYNETNEASVDLATALRGCLNLKFTYGQNKGSFHARSDKAYGKGTYADTLTRASGLKGAFKDCRENIQTCVDAAYYLLNNIFVDNSYNQLQNDFGYMTLSGATVKDEDDADEKGKFAYVFDAGFTTGLKGNETDANYINDSQAAIKYTPYMKEENDQWIFGDGTISLHNVNSKDMWWYDTYNTTTRFPFLPIYDNEGDYADNSTSYYFCDDGVRSYRTDFGTYQGRNYNYVLASNGEFVYREEDGLFFQFEGDDDVYLFINGQIVLDIGGAHSITSVSINVDDYVKDARAAMEPLKANGYYAGMPNTTFDAMIDGDTLPVGTWNAKGKFVQTGTTPNNYTADQRIMLKRQHRLNLVEGQICQFDFYYMERHGYGANMRIVTNMHVTDSKLGVEKSAHQYGEEIEYGGIIDPASPAEYNFKLTNNGNMKLYNLTFSDATIGVELSYETGLSVDSSMNGLYVLDANNQKLDASDLTAVVAGWKPVPNGQYAKNNATGKYEKVAAGQSGSHDYVEVEVTFADNDALIEFLQTLEAEGMETSTTTEEITQAGSGLWVDASVRFKGIYYILTPEQVEKGMIQNTVYVTATNKADPHAVGCEILRADATHRAYTSGAPSYFQWAGNPLYLAEREILLDADNEAGVKDGQLSQYEKFFAQVVEQVNGETVAHTDRIYSRLCDKYGRTLEYDEVETVTGNDSGFVVNYPTSGTHTFYLLMFLNEENGGYPAGTTVDQIIAAMKEKNEDLPEDEWICDYAVVRITVFTASVEDSYYVLDYGLKTESLDTNGELFKNDYLFGDTGGMEAKLMGITNKQPSYLAYGSSSKYNQISFNSISGTTLTPYVDSGDPDGSFNVNMVLPDNGKPITYDSVTGKYSLTGAGTVKINAKVPQTSAWEKVCLYYWYDNGTNNGWPGTEMKYTAGEYSLEIPGDVTHVIVNNGSVALQTPDLSITPGVESTIVVSVSSDNKVSAEVVNVVKDVNAHISVPSGWGKVYLHYKTDEGEWVTTEEITNVVDGYYVTTIPGDASYVYVSDGGSKRSDDMDIIAGLQFWLDLRSNGNESYGAELAYSKEFYTIRAHVPGHWDDEVFLYYWYSGSTSIPVGWPGVQMTDEGNGWYTMQVPVGVSSVIINDRTNQTVDLMVQSGLETKIEINNRIDESVGKYTASVTSDCLNFTPTDFMDSENSIWLAVTVHTTGVQPTVLGKGIDTNNEVQMFKKVTVLPANVVYYEDDFDGIQYNTDNTSNTFNKLGDGSGSLSQSVDQTTPYGQDATYQDSENAQLSGGSLQKITIGAVSPDKQLPNAATFSFTGSGFELISRTNAVDSASFTVIVYNSQGEMIRMMPVITQFDNGSDLGDEAIYQVPAIRMNLDVVDTYSVEVVGTPEWDFADWQNPTFVETYLYIDGLRIFQPLGSKNDHYNEVENGADFVEIRDQIATGTIGVAQLTGSQLSVSSGVTTWTEDLHVDDKLDVYTGQQVDSTDAYLIQGPNNEAYMVGGSINSALVLYVSERADQDNRELQIAVRGLDYGMFNGNGEDGLYATLQLGITTENGYGWKDIATVVSGTEQYYSIPYQLCPRDAQGNYQVVLRTMGEEFGQSAMVSYTSLKSLNLSLKAIEGVGEASILYYANGMLVSPDYFLFGNIDGKDVTDANAKYQFVNNELKIQFTQTSYVGILRRMVDTKDLYQIDGANTGDSSATLLHTAQITGQKGYMMIPAGHTLNLKLRQSNNSTVVVSYDLSHVWDEGTITTKPTCTTDGVITYKCTQCSATKTAPIPKADHDFVNGVCSVCGEMGKRMIYVRNTFGYSKLNIYTWTGNTTYTGSWPGNAMTLVAGSTDLYCYEVPVAAKNIIFNDGSNQTGDLTLPAIENLYIPAEDRWITYTPDCAHSTHSTTGYCNSCGIAVPHNYVNGQCSICGKSDPTGAGYYLIGYINGADYGCESDYANLGRYKFVDGKVIATFSQDSYVFIKTGDNNNWYMFQSYTTDTTGNLYLTGTGTSEKMFVPGNVEITFTLKANADGSLTLSYTAASQLDMSSFSTLNLASIQAQLSVDFQEVESITQPTLDMCYPSLSFEDEICYNVYYAASNLEDVVEMGLITFDSKLEDGTVADATEVIPGYSRSGENYVSSTNGIPAKNLSDTLYFKVYAKLSDGTYAYSDVAGYNAVAYANTILNNASSSAKAKALVVAMLNYGAAAQVYFDYNADNLMNASLTAEQLALVEEYNDTMINDVVKADASKTGVFVHNGGYTK